MALTDRLILPNSLQRHRASGETKVLRCTLCGKEYPLDHGHKLARHARKCSEVNRDHIEATIAHHHRTVFTRPWDVEKYEHYRKGGN